MERGISVIIIESLNFYHPPTILPQIYLLYSSFRIRICVNNNSRAPRIIFSIVPHPRSFSVNDSTNKLDTRVQRFDYQAFSSQLGGGGLYNVLPLLRAISLLKTV